MFVPIVPLLVGTGALAAHGQMQPFWAVLALGAGVAAGDYLWYVIGRRRGVAILGRLCRIALEPSTCLRRTENLFARYGAAALLVAKFVPGLSTIALPLAGVFKMRPRRFVVFDVAGVFCWVSAYLLLGYASSGALAAIGSRVRLPGSVWIVLAAGALVAYVAFKQVQRRLVIRKLRVAKISVEDLHRRIEAGDRIAVIDLRHPLDFEADPYTIPTAIYIPAEELSERHAEIPRDRDVVLYCTCPDEITSAKEALRLRRRGIRRVRPLQGGFAAWRAAQLPVVLRGPIVPVADRMLNAA